MNTFLVGIILFVLAVIIAVVLLFRGAGTPPSQGEQPLPLPDYASTDAVVSMTTVGQVNGDDVHRSIRIAISKDQRVLQVLTGYSGEVIENNSDYNTQPAYETFLLALNYAGFMNKNQNVKVPEDGRGLCPLGNRFIFDLSQDGFSIYTAWASTCGRAVGNLASNSGLLQTLFKNQITDYGGLTSGVDL